MEKIDSKTKNENRTEKNTNQVDSILTTDIPLFSCERCYSCDSIGFIEFLSHGLFTGSTRYKKGEKHAHYVVRASQEKIAPRTTGEDKNSRTYSGKFSPIHHRSPHTRTNDIQEARRHAIRIDSQGKLLPGREIAL